MRDNTFQHRASQTRYIWLYDYKYAARHSSCPPLRSCLDFAQGNRDCRMCGRNLNCASGAGTMIVKSPLNVRAGIAPAGWHGADMQQFAILGALRFQARPFHALRPSGPSARGRNLSRPCRKRPHMPEGGLPPPAPQPPRRDDRASYSAAENATSSTATPASGKSRIGAASPIVGKIPRANGRFSCFLYKTQKL